MCGVSTAQTTKDIPKDVAYKKFIERINGQWKLQRVVDIERKVESANSPNNRKTQKSDNQKKGTETVEGTNAMQMIEFEDDARYRVNNSTNAIDSGSYRLNEQHGILYLESDSDDITPTEWAVSIRNNTLTLTGRGNDATSRYRYVYSKSKTRAAK